MSDNELKGGEGVKVISSAQGRKPHRVAVIQDWGSNHQPLYDQYDATRLAFEEATKSGLLDRPVEMQVFELEGLPFMRSEQIVEEIRKIVHEWEPIALIGPHTSEDVLLMKPYLNQWQIPTIVQSGTAEVSSEWIFGTQNGSFADEAVILADWLAEQGCKRIGVLREDNLFGDEYSFYVRQRLRQLKLNLAADIILPTFMSADETDRAMVTMQDSGVDGYVYGGLGFASKRVLVSAKTAAAKGWNPPRCTGSIYMGSIPGLGYGLTPEDYEGWTGIDQYDETNPVFMAMLDRFAARFDGRRPMHCYTASGFDMGNLVANGISLSRAYTRQGLKLGLERVKRLPAAAGGPGTIMTCGQFDHRSFKGPYISLRRVHNGVNELIKSL